MAAEAHHRAGWITVEQACRLLGVSDEWLRQLAKKRAIPRAEKGMYPLVGLVQGYIKYLRQDEQDSTAAAAGRRVSEARIREVELRIAEREHRVIDRDEHIGVIDELCGLFISEMNGLPARITRDLPFRDRMRAEIDAMRGRIAARTAQRAEELKVSGTSAATGTD